MRKVLITGYVSLDHMVHINTKAQIGNTSIVNNKSCGKIFAGGCSVNIAYGLSKFGVEGMPLINVGDDYERSGLKDFIKKAKISDTCIKQVPNEITSTTFMIQDKNNDHITLFYPGAMDDKYDTELPNEILSDIDLAILTVAPIKDNKKVIAKCLARKIPIVFGMKDCEASFPKPFLWDILKSSDIIFTNEIERKSIEERYAIKSITELFEIGIAKEIITTCGGKGSIIYTKDGGRFIVDANKCKVVDASGCGDSFIAGYIYGYLNKYDPELCGKLGTLFASSVIEKEGCCTNYPSMEMVNKLVKGE